MRHSLYVLILISLLFGFSCSKEEGAGLLINQVRITNPTIPISSDTSNQVKGEINIVSATIAFDRYDLKSHGSNFSYDRTLQVPVMNINLKDHISNEINRIEIEASKYSRLESALYLRNNTKPNIVFRGHYKSPNDVTVPIRYEISSRRMFNLNLDELDVDRGWDITAELTIDLKSIVEGSATVGNFKEVMNEASGDTIVISSSQNPELMGLIEAKLEDPLFTRYGVSY